MRHSEAAQGCVDMSQVFCALGQWWSGGAFLLCGTGCVSWTAEECGDGQQSCTSGSGSSAHWKYGWTELSKATRGESKGISLFPCRCSALCTAELSSFRQERFWAAVAPFQELIRTWNRAQALKCISFRLRVAAFLTAVIKQGKPYKFVLEFLALELHGLRELPC